MVLKSNRVRTFCVDLGGSRVKLAIVEDGRVVGVFSENTLLAYMNTSNIVVISENDTFEKVRDFLKK